MAFSLQQHTFLIPHDDDAQPDSPPQPPQPQLSAEERRRLYNQLIQQESLSLRARSANPSFSTSSPAETTHTLTFSSDGGIERFIENPNSLLFKNKNSVSSGLKLAISNGQKVKERIKSSLAQVVEVGETGITSDLKKLMSKSRFGSSPVSTVKNPKRTSTGSVGRVGSLKASITKVGNELFKGSEDEPRSTVNEKRSTITAWKALLMASNGQEGRKTASPETASLSSVSSTVPSGFEPSSRPERGSDKEKREREKQRKGEKGHVEDTRKSYHNGTRKGEEKGKQGWSFEEESSPRDSQVTLEDDEKRNLVLEAEIMIPVPIPKRKAEDERINFLPSYLDIRESVMTMRASTVAQEENCDVKSISSSQVQVSFKPRIEIDDIIDRVTSSIPGWAGFSGDAPPPLPIERHLPKKLPSGQMHPLKRSSSHPGDLFDIDWTLEKMKKEKRRQRKLQSKREEIYEDEDISPANSCGSPVYSPRESMVVKPLSGIRSFKNQRFDTRSIEQVEERTLEDLDLSIALHLADGRDGQPVVQALMARRERMVYERRA
ncbi:hypothetical protein HDU67_010205 [Dinochytrium kinnereticum]|nr:hypothetical protein HDU67_010205 [Dinochytrium kinnereticum]